MSIQAIVFDFGNVVGLFDHRLTSRRLAAQSALTVDALHAHLFGGQLEADYEAGRLSTADFLERVRQTCGLRCPAEVVAGAWADIFSPNEPVCALLPELKRQGYRLLLASNTNDLHAQQFRRQFDTVLRLFDDLVLSHEIGVRKPAAAFFEHCRGLAGCAPQECLFIDDLPANVAGAQACGWQGIVYTGMDDLRVQLTARGIVLAGPNAPVPDPHTTG